MQVHTLVLHRPQSTEGHVAHKHDGKIYHPSHLSNPKHRVDWGHYNSNSNPQLDQLIPRWMDSINPTMPVSFLSIPGTHDSATHSCRWYQFCDITQCQSWNTYGQLQAGIRFLDFRVNTKDSKLIMGHGVSSFDSLESQLVDVKKFIDQQPTEAIIIAFQNNDRGPERSTEILQLFDRLGIKYLLRQTVPTLGEIRGKVWILAGYGLMFSGQTFCLFGSEGVG